MALWTIGDLHLSHGTDKPMDIFGDRWKDHSLKIEKFWKENIHPQDTIVIPGDVSWAISLSEVQHDFAFLHGLSGKKILLKGNHDYWWETVSKMKRLLSEQGMDDIDFLQNNHFMYNDVAICGTRGWSMEGENHEKMILREAGRLELSLSSAPLDAEKYVFLHYPPIFVDHACMPFIEVMQKYGVKKCYYGHLHGISIQNAVVGKNFGINFSLVSADSLDFCLYNILK